MSFETERGKWHVASKQDPLSLIGVHIKNFGYSFTLLSSLGSVHLDILYNDDSGLDSDGEKTNRHKKTVFCFLNFN